MKTQNKKTKKTKPTNTTSFPKSLYFLQALRGLKKSRIRTAPRALARHNNNHYKKTIDDVRIAPKDKYSHIHEHTHTHLSAGIDMRKNSYQATAATRGRCCHIDQANSSSGARWCRQAASQKL